MGLPPGEAGAPGAGLRAATAGASHLALLCAPVPRLEEALGREWGDPRCRGAEARRGVVWVIFIPSPVTMKGFEALVI